MSESKSLILKKINAFRPTVININKDDETNTNRLTLKWISIIGIFSGLLYLFFNLNLNKNKK